MLGGQSWDLIPQFSREQELYLQCTSVTMGIPNGTVNTDHPVSGNGDI